MSKCLRVGGVPEHFNLPWRLAVADDAFRRAGVPVDYQEFPGGTGDMARALREDRIDIALVLTEGGVADIIEHDQNRLVKVYAGSPLIWGIHVAARSKITRISDIRGKRFAISRFGSGSHLIAIVDAAMRGWSIDDKQFIVIGDLDGARRALKNANADVFLWERFTTQPLVDSGEFRRVGQREVPWPAFCVSVRREVLQRRSASVRRVLEISDRYARNLMRRKGAPELIANTYGLNIADARSWFSHVRWTMGFRPPMAALERSIEALQSQGSYGDIPMRAEGVWQRL